MVDFGKSGVTSTRSYSTSGSQRSGGGSPAPKKSGPPAESLSAKSVITGQQYGSVEERKAADEQARMAAAEARARGRAPAQPASQGKYASSVKGSARSSEAEALIQQSKQERAAGNQQNAAMLERRAAEAMQRAANRQVAEREVILRKPTATGQAVPGQGGLPIREIPFQTVEGQTQSRLEASRFKQVIVASPGFAGKAATIPGLEVSTGQNVLVQTEEGYRPGGSVTTVGVRDPLIFTEDEQNVVQREIVLRGDHTPQINESAREYIPLPGRDYSPVAGPFSPVVLPASVLASPSFTGFVGKNIFVAPFGSGQEKQVVEHGQVLQLEEKPGLAFDEKGLHHALLYNYAPLDKDYKTWSQKQVLKAKGYYKEGKYAKWAGLALLSAPASLVEPFVHTAVSPFRALVKPTPYSMFQQKIEQDKTDKISNALQNTGSNIDVHRESGVLASIKNYWKNLKFQTEYHQYEQLEKARDLPRTPAQQKTDQARREQIQKEFKEDFGKNISQIYPEIKKSYETQRVKDIGYTSETEAQFGQEAAIMTAGVATGSTLLRGAGSLAGQVLPKSVASAAASTAGKTAITGTIAAGVEAPQVYTESKEYGIRTALIRSAGRIATYAAGIGIARKLMTKTSTKTTSTPVTETTRVQKVQVAGTGTVVKTIPEPPTSKNLPNIKVKQKADVLATTIKERTVGGKTTSKTSNIEQIQVLTQGEGWQTSQAAVLKTELKAGLPGEKPVKIGQQAIKVQEYGPGNKKFVSTDVLRTPENTGLLTETRMKQTGLIKELEAGQKTIQASVTTQEGINQGVKPKRPYFTLPQAKKAFDLPEGPMTGSTQAISKEIMSIESPAKRIVTARQGEFKLTKKWSGGKTSVHAGIQAHESPSRVISEKLDLLTMSKDDPLGLKKSSMTDPLGMEKKSTQYVNQKTKQILGKTPSKTMSEGEQATILKKQQQTRSITHSDIASSTRTSQETAMNAAKRVLEKTKTYNDVVTESVTRKPSVTALAGVMATGQASSMITRQARQQTQASKSVQKIISEANTVPSQAFKQKPASPKTGQERVILPKIKQTPRQIPAQMTRQDTRQALQQVPNQIIPQTTRHMQEFPTLMPPPIIPGIPGGFGRQPGLGPKSPYRGERTYKVITPARFKKIIAGVNSKKKLRGLI